MLERIFGIVICGFVALTMSACSMKKNQSRPQNINGCGIVWEYRLRIFLIGPNSLKNTLSFGIGFPANTKRLIANATLIW